MSRPRRPSCTKGTSCKDSRRSVHGDDDFAEGVTLADVREGGGDIVECEGAVDVDGDVAGDAQVGQWLEVGWALLHCEDPQRAMGEPAGEPADRQDAEQRSQRPADAAVTAVAKRVLGGRRTPIDERRGRG